MAKRARTELAAKDAAAHGPAPPAVADGTPLFDAADFAALNEATKAYDAQRDAVIRRSRDMQKAAKTAIYCLHRADAAGAERELTTFAAVAAELQARKRRREAAAASRSLSSPRSRRRPVRVRAARHHRRAVAAPRRLLRRCGGVHRRACSRPGIHAPADAVPRSYARRGGHLQALPCHRPADGVLRVPSGAGGDAGRVPWRPCVACRPLSPPPSAAL